MLLIMLLCVSLLCICSYFYAQSTCNSKNLPNVFEYASNMPGNTVLFVAGTHGNEPAGTVALYELKKKLDNKELVIKQGKLILVPEVNTCGLLWGIRSIPFVGDINRQYSDETTSNINVNIANIAKTSNFVADFHEGWGYHGQNSQSVGSTISYANTLLSKQIAMQAVNNINNTIQEPTKKFILLGSDREQINGTLSMFLKNKNYILIETTGQHNVQPLSVRVDQNNIVIKTVLFNLGLI